MLNLDKLSAVTEIIVHKNCPDGTASAILLHDVLPDARVRFVQYGTDEHKTLTAASGQLFCDMSPPADNYQPFIDAGAMVLDHHATAKPIVEAFGENGVFGDEKRDPGICGATLAYKHVWCPLSSKRSKGHIVDRTAEAAPEKSFEQLAEDLTNDLAGKKDAHDLAVDALQKELEFAFEFARLAGIRDTWQNKDPSFGRSCEQAEMLRFFPEEDWLERKKPFAAENVSWWQERYKLGELLYKKHLKSVGKCIERAFLFTSEKSTRVAVFEGVRMSSDVAEQLGDTVDLVLSFDYEVEQINSQPVRKVIFSTRSHSSFNCAIMAKSLGGGGHTKAAGFMLVIDDDGGPSSQYAYSMNPYSLAKKLVQVHEGTGW